MCLALSQPERIDSICILDMAPVSYDSKKFDDMFSAMICMDIGSIKSVKEMKRLLDEKLGDPPLVSFLLTNVDYDEKNSKYFWRSPLEILKRHLPEIRGWPEEETSHLAPFNKPALFLHGSNSDYVSEEAKVKIRKLFPLSKFVCVEGAGHWIHVDRTKQVLGELVSFLSH